MIDMISFKTEGKTKDYLNVYFSEDNVKVNVNGVAEVILSEDDIDFLIEMLKNS